MAKTSFRFGFAAVVGKPNVGKSSLINCLAGAKVSITSRRPQTTRNQIPGVINRPDFQLVLVDTPGIHRPRGPLNQWFDRTARDSIRRAEISVMVIDARGWRIEDDVVWKAVDGSTNPIFLLINKVDLLDKPDRLLPLIQECSQRGEIAEIIPVSAKTGHNTCRFLELIRERLPVGQPGYPLNGNGITNLEFSVAELVREQVFRLAGAEIPYQTAVTVDSPPRKETTKPEFHAEIWVESAGQKAIVIGARGERLRNIGTRARKQIEYLLETDVVLTTKVKVRQGWSSDLSRLRDLGYGR